MELSKKILYLTGLPRSGSTLLCQLLAHHPEIYSPGHSSPLAHVIERLRQQLSDDPFLLAQLDVDFDLTYARLLNAHRGFLNGWFAETDRPWVVDKNRGWMGMVETVAALDPDFRMVVCVREPAQIYGSIEAQHQQTILLDFPDHLASHSRYARADNLFGDSGVIGRPLAFIRSLQEVPPALQQRLYYVVFEHLMVEPVTVMSELWHWLSLPPAPIDPNNLTVRPHESDSHYRFKYPHRTRQSICPPVRHEIPPRILDEIHGNFRWFYEIFYPGMLG